MNYKVDENGFFGKFGGAYVPEILYKCVTDLQKAYLPIMESEEFKTEYRALLRDYVGRPSPLYYAKRMSEKYGCKLYLKREDLNHTGAHKINNTVGQILMAKKMGKTRIIAETGAGQHGVATATVCALMNMECEIFMGKTDVERQHTNVERMKMLGAKVHPVTTGNMTLSDACSEAIRDWCCHPKETFYIVGSTMGPHPYPDIVARMQSIISEEIKWQLEEKIGRDYPDYLIACVGGGSNAAGTIYHYIDDERYAANYVRNAQSKKSRMRIRQDLMQKGVAKETIEAALEEEYVSDEENQIRELLTKRKFDYKTADEKEFRRTYSFLLRRGFKANDILRVMKYEEPYYLT